MGEMEQDTANAIGETLGVEPLWIMEGKGPISRENSKGKTQQGLHSSETIDQFSNVKPIISVSDTDFVVVPKALNKLSTRGETIPEGGADAANYAFKLDWLKSKVCEVENALLVEVEGDSMLPLFRNGDVVMLDLGDTIPTVEGVYGIAVGNVIQIKRLTPLPGNEVRVISTNSDFYDYTTKIVDLEIIGRVVWHDHSLA
jgi:phage repressor protein C with HTH and peptisase S24 domain